MPELTTELLVQGLAALFLLLWAGRNALQAKRDTVTATQPNPMVAAVSMAWDRDMQERFLQLIERMAKASEEQALLQKQMAGSWSAMSDHQREDMNKKIERLLSALDDAEARKDLLGMISGSHR
jgi:ABC-type phosphate/phosphonate transport system substrate-binding protein